MLKTDHNPDPDLLAQLGWRQLSSFAVDTFPSSPNHSLFAFSKMQFGSNAAGGCVRHWEGKEERRSQDIHSPAGETTYQQTGQNSQQSGFWRTGLGPAQHRPISSFPDVHFAWVPVFSPRWLPVSSISILPLSPIQQHSTGTPLSSFLPEDALACS